MSIGERTAGRDKPLAVRGATGMVVPVMRFFNTLGRKLEEFRPKSDELVSLYTCGPTVYSAPHIGNLRTFLFEDVLRRALESFGYRVRHIMNLTDVEDKIIAAAGRAGMSVDEFTEPHIRSFHDDLERLQVLPAHEYPRATRYIAPMIGMIEELLAKDHAYLSDGSVFFRIASFPRYGELSRIRLDQVRRGERVADDEYGKDDARDFVLWKASKEGEPSWPSRWGPGRPGWHIECSAMSQCLLGPEVDIHCGGVDNIFPHHENEIAQSECVHDARFVRYWLHAEHLLVDGEKMSKSLGNQYTLSDLEERGLDLRLIRHFLTAVHYRQKLNFTFDAVAGVAASLRRVDEMLFRLKAAAPLASAVSGDELVGALDAAERGFREALGDDLNVAGALAQVFNAVRETNRAIDRGISTDEIAAFERFFLMSNEVFPTLQPEKWEPSQGGAGGAEGLDDSRIDVLVAARTAARANRDFREADRIREELTAAGVVLEDRSDTTVWRRS